MTIFDAIDATWPPARFEECGPFMLRAGEGGGKRVSAASCDGEASEAQVMAAAARMRDVEQVPLFMLRGDQSRLDSLLEVLGYSVIDPVVILSGSAEMVAGGGPEPVSAFPIWPPLTVMTELWAETGVGPERLAVMDRADCPKTGLLGRSNDHPAGCVFVALYETNAMLHALEVLPNFRRKGCATNMVRGAAAWAMSEGAEAITALTTRDNSKAQALFASLGMKPVEKYHYRIHSKAEAPS